MMRLMDSDILTYALNAKHSAHPYCWPAFQKAVRGEMEMAIAIQSLLESYNALVYDYKIERREPATNWMVSRGIEKSLFSRLL